MQSGEIVVFVRDYASEFQADRQPAKATERESNRDACFLPETDEVNDNRKYDRDAHFMN